MSGWGGCSEWVGWVFRVVGVVVLRLWTGSFGEWVGWVFRVGGVGVQNG